MAIKVNGTDIILNDRSLAVPNGYVGFGSISAEALLDVTGMEVGDTIYVSDQEVLATWNGTEWVGIKNTTSAVVTGGDVATPGNGYQYNVFTSPGTLTVTSEGVLDYLVIAGGGSGGGHYGGGGGAGGVVAGEEVEFSATTYNVEIGQGGFKVSGFPGKQGTPGGDSRLGNLTAIGGGGGAGRGSGHGIPGGSGGGATQDFSTFGDGTTGQGNPGGPQNQPGNGGSGGGGAGGIGASGGSPRAGGAGGTYPIFAAPLVGPAVPSPERPGWISTVGPTGNYAGGGGGGDQDNPGGVGGAGGGGAGGGPSGGRGSDGRRFTGSGGGGAAQSSNGSESGSGGNGIVIIRTEL